MYFFQNCPFKETEDNYYHFLRQAMVNVEGSGMVGVKGVARRLFGTLESTGINVVLISQASSEHSITFATTIQQAEAAKAAIEEEFHKEVKQVRSQHD